MQVTFAALGKPRRNPYCATKCKALEQLQILDLPSQIFLRFTEFLLKSPEQLVLFPFSKREIIVAQLRVFLFQFAFHFVPPAFEL